MKRHIEYHSAIKFLKDSGFGLNKTISMSNDPLIKQFEYWEKEDGAEVYLLEVLDTDFAFMFKLI